MTILAALLLVGYFGARFLAAVIDGIAGTPGTKGRP